MKKISLVIFALLSIILFTASCCKPTIEVITLLRNSTDEEIELKYFDSNGQIILNAIKGKSEIKSIPGLPLPIDSILVYIKGSLQEVHYGKTIKRVTSNTKIIPFENSRNLLNENNYQKSRQELSCNGSVTTYLYIF